MDPSGSFLLTVVERVRAYLDEPTVDGKYDDDFLVNHIIIPAYVDVISRLNNTASNPIVLFHSFTLDQTQDYYDIPPCVREVLRLVSASEDGRILQDHRPRNRMSFEGPRWALENNQIYIPNLHPATASLEMWYVPSANVLPMYYAQASATASTTAKVKSLTVGTTPTLGQRDRRNNAYAGQVCRFLFSEDGLSQTYERVIESSTYNSISELELTFRTDLPSEVQTISSDLSFEICPPGAMDIAEAVATAAAMKLGVYRGMTNVRSEMLRRQYVAAIKSVGDQVANFQQRDPKRFDNRTADNRDRASYLLGFSDSL